MTLHEVSKAGSGQVLFQLVRCVCVCVFEKNSEGAVGE